MINLTRRISNLFPLLALLLAFFLPVPAVQAQAGSAITSPGTGSSVRGSVPVRGTAISDSFARYELYFKLEPSGDESYVWFAGNTAQVNNGELGTWHTGDLPSGTYTLRLRIVRPDGNYGEFFARDLRVNLEPPTPTPTSTPDGPTPTPIPIDTPTPITQPTPVVVSVTQPDLAEPTATATAELIALNSGGSGSGSQPAASSESQVARSADAPSEGNAITRELSAAISIDRLSERFFTGARWAGGIFILIFALFAAKWLIQWALARVG
ncbi:MAG: hypothetical protein KJZ86_19845 [Caldilineaceae bacterium]|nr:hypothetical protein [Caldilineaceae bacterium]HRJ41235.1 hypothetical protein [Caldilineaceae bacterium]